MFKVILSFVLIAATTLYGFIISRRLTIRRQALESIVDSIVRMRSLIGFGGYEISRVIKSSFGCSKGFESFDYSSFDEDNLPTLWINLVNTISGELCLNSEDKELLVKFSEGIGITDTDGQLANCDLYCELFKERIADAKEKEKASGRLYKIIGFSFGCVITLMIV
ncbi:MAG: stage III sporulation protein AB [Ruminococcus sp.]|nr:stage III sporulation protein AB [Ruminococcus sp.]